ncbi:response regulator transcription factor [Aneurinibacillus migulanus]|uniref:response regulator transcription factor n=1 Tax=Aneurinibacillus migulanus TaxID=47500 RepID=UPI001113A6CA|nr:response regulator transcription factor [Aneurinibacillus migulanus]MED0896457.1 response regulator transcription factor [Aneurinibacillus migulanus]MED1618209.1 response regulator transcription factor [Aneurinibacillus migulanus]
MLNEKILLVDDEKGLLDMLQTLLKKEGLTNVDFATKGHEALTLSDKETYSVIVLDVMMPDMDGFELCRRLREKTFVPIIFLTARTTDLDKLMGLGIGGDDYITKPFNPLEVVARIKAQLRRHHLYKDSTQIKHESFDFGFFQLNKTSGQLIVRGKEVECPAREFELLTFLCEHPNHIFSIQQLYERIWGQSSIGDEKTVTIHISRLRRKIEPNPKKPQFLINIRGLGYKFVPLVQREK